MQPQLASKLDHCRIRCTLAGDGTCCQFLTFLVCVKLAPRMGSLRLESWSSGPPNPPARLPTVGATFDGEASAGLVCFLGV